MPTVTLSFAVKSGRPRPSAAARRTPDWPARGRAAPPVSHPSGTSPTTTATPSGLRLLCACRCFCFDPCFPLPTPLRGIYFLYATCLPIVFLHRRSIFDYKTVKTSKFTRIPERPSKTRQDPDTIYTPRGCPSLVKVASKTNPHLSRSTFLVAQHHGCHLQAVSGLAKLFAAG